MKKPYIFFIVAVSVVVGLLFASHSSEAQTKKTAVADFTAIERMESLVAELDASGQTNIITKVSDLVSALQMAETTHEASTTLALLRQLRAGHTNEAITMLEKQLDGDLVRFGASTNEIREAEIGVLKQVREYRTEYPHKAAFPYTDATLNQTFNLLDKP
jgi:multidrug efflux pump subunit AcrA (membrane-fusion protein)